MLSITYLSAAFAALTPRELAHIVEQSRCRNAAKDITGVLVYSAGTFVQTLEGPTAAVTELYDDIVGDVRHTEVIEVWRETIMRRTFSTWSMAFKELTEAEAAAVPELRGALATSSPADADLSLSPDVLLRLVDDGAGSR